jgi:hypothetical protein
LLGALALMPLLRRRVQAGRVLRRVVLGTTLSASRRLTPSNYVLIRLLRRVLLLVPCEPGSDAA